MAWRWPAGSGATATERGLGTTSDAMVLTPTVDCRQMGQCSGLGWAKTRTRTRAKAEPIYVAWFGKTIAQASLENFLLKKTSLENLILRKIIYGTGFLLRGNLVGC